MRKSPRKSLLLSSDEEAPPSFVAKSFYQSRGKRQVYLNPLERLELRQIQAAATAQEDQPQKVQQIKTSIPNKAVQTSRKISRKPVKKSKLHSKRNMKTRNNEPVTTSHKPVQKSKTPTKQQRQKSPSKRTPRKSPKIAKKGVKLYMQNWRKQQKKRTGKGEKAALLKKRVMKGNSIGKSGVNVATEQTIVTKKVAEKKDTARGLDFGKVRQEVHLQNDVKEPKEVGEIICTDGDTEMMDVSTDTLFDNIVEDKDNVDMAPLSTEEKTSAPKSNLKRKGENRESPSKKNKVDNVARQSPRKRRMKTGAESLEAVGEAKSVDKPSCAGNVDTKLEQEFEEWLWSPGKISEETGMVEGLQSIVNQILETPESSMKDKFDSPKKAVTGTPKLYPVFTPPTTPSSTKSSTSLAQKKQTALHTPQPKSPTAWNKLRDKDGMEQMVLDLGQKYFGAVTCDTCGMVYTATHPEDEANHAVFHRKYLSSTKFKGWKNEEVIEEFPDGRIIVINPDAPKYAHRKVEEVRELVDRELGFVEGNTLSGKELCKTFLFITSDKKICGCLISEGISKGYRVIPDETPPASQSSDSSEESKKAWCCENMQEPAVCGVSRIWVAGLMRRKKIATRLMEALRNHYTFGSILTMDDIAFSDPTPDGKLFATTYTKTPRFLVYKYN